MISKSRIVVAVALLTAASLVARAIGPNESGDRAAIEAFTRKFLRAFEDLDMKQFIACFTEHATVFFPMPEPPERAQGKDAIRRRFERVFASIRSAARSGPPGCATATPGIASSMPVINGSAHTRESSR